VKASNETEMGKNGENTDFRSFRRNILQTVEDKRCYWPVI